MRVETIDNRGNNVATMVKGGSVCSNGVRKGKDATLVKILSHDCLQIVAKEGKRRLATNYNKGKENDIKQVANSTS